MGLGGDLEVVDMGDLSLSSRGGVAGGVGRSSRSSSSRARASLEAACRASSMETSVDLLLESSMLSNEVLRLISKPLASHLWLSTESFDKRGSVLILRGSLLLRFPIVSEFLKNEKKESILFERHFKFVVFDMNPRLQKKIYAIVDIVKFLIAL